jgi:hypothetical protein
LSNAIEEKSYALASAAVLADSHRARTKGVIVLRYGVNAGICVCSELMPSRPVYRP